MQCGYQIWNASFCFWPLADSRWSSRCESQDASLGLAIEGGYDFVGLSSTD